MFAAIFAFSYAFLLFSLVSEADSDLLKVLGFLAGLWMTIAGAYSGWSATRA